MCCVSFGAASNLPSGSFLVLAWLRLMREGGRREVRHVFHLRLGIDNCCRRHLLGLRRACLRDVSQWVWLRRQHGDQVKHLANQIFHVVARIFVKYSKVFLPQRTKAGSLDGTEAGCTLSNYFKGLAEELPPINQGFS